jgi:hypothetical protein
MASPLKKHLTPEEIARLSSSYLKEGKRQDIWEITDIVIENKILIAHIRMRSHYISPTDKGGFHLTILSTLEFLSQLMMIFVHVQAGYAEKTKEGWMLESAISCKRTIRDKENIEVRMELASMKKVKGSILVVSKSQVSDKDGLYEATLKGLLS